VESGAERTVVCPGCGRRVSMRPKAAPAAPAAPTGRPEADVGPLPADHEPTRPRAESAKPRTPAKRRKKHRNVSRPTWPWVLAAAGGGVVAVAVLVVGVMLALRAAGPRQVGGGQRQVEEDRQAREQAAPVNEFPPVAWTLQPAPGPKIDFPDHLA